MPDSYSQDKSSAAPDSGIPSWQRQGTPNDGSDTDDETATTAAAAPPSRTGDAKSRLDVARRFLEDDQVRTASRESKAGFLRSKGVGEEDIRQLLDEGSDRDGENKSIETTSSSAESTAPSQQLQASPSAQQQKPLSNPNTHTATTTTTTDRPPIVTYPEFLTKSPRPPPLVTSTGVVNALLAAAGLSTLLYGASKYLVAPMVDALTDARVEYHATVSEKLKRAVAQLEDTVTVLPKGYGNARDKSSQRAVDEGDETDDAEDPSEMFHRDIGTQTADVLEPVCADSKPDLPSLKGDGQVLGEINDALREIEKSERMGSDSIIDTIAVVDDLRDDLDALTFTGTEYANGFDVYNRARKNEPDDEMRRVRDNIRSVKGVLLRTRNFPAATT